MSFSSRVKEELCALPAGETHCVFAELKALGSSLPDVAKKRYQILTAELTEIEIANAAESTIKRQCCKRAYSRGSFIAWGTCSNPKKAYHMEFNCPSEKNIKELCEILRAFKLRPKQNKMRVYLKEGSHIADVLNIMGAHLALMEYENIRIVKDINNKINRQVNFETANLEKTVSAAVQQVEDIKFIAESVGLGFMTESLETIARLRLDHTDATLKEIGQMLSPPIGKSGVNHRLRKISAIAASLRSSAI